MGALLVGVGTAAGLIAWGVAPWLATLAGHHARVAGDRVCDSLPVSAGSAPARRRMRGARGETTARVLADVSRLRATGPRSGHQMMK